jgi:restriction system protein
MWPALKALKAMGGSASNEELLAKIIEPEKIPENIQSYLHTDHRQTRLGYNLAWARTYLQRVGAIENSTRGVWSLTEAGEQMNDQDCEKVPAVRRPDAELKRAKDKQLPENAPPISEASPEESWKDTLIGVLRQMPPDAFSFQVLFSVQALPGHRWLGRGSGFPWCDGRPMR